MALNRDSFKYSLAPSGAAVYLADGPDAQDRQFQSGRPGSFIRTFGGFGRLSFIPLEPQLVGRVDFGQRAFGFGQQPNAIPPEPDSLGHRRLFVGPLPRLSQLERFLYRSAAAV